MDIIPMVGLCSGLLLVALELYVDMSGRDQTHINQCTCKAITHQTVTLATLTKFCPVVLAVDEDSVSK